MQPSIDYREAQIVRKVTGKRLSRLMRTYYLGPNHPMKLRFWGSFRKWSKYARLTIPYAERGWITIDERDLLQRQILIEGSYELEVWETLAAFATVDEVVWDIGAHIGSFAIQALTDLRVREIHAFEPDPVHADILEINLTLNPGRHAVHRMALGSERQRRKLYHGPVANTGLSSLANRVSSQVFEVECRSIDELVFVECINPPTLMKIDVEDWESRVLRGASRLLSEKPPKAIVFESKCDANGEILDQSIVDHLTAVDYRVRRIHRPSGLVDQRENFLASHAQRDQAAR